MLAGNSAGRLGDTLSRLVRTGQRTLDRVGATLGSLMRAHEGAGHRIAAGQRNRSGPPSHRANTEDSRGLAGTRLLGDVLACHGKRRRVHAAFMSPNENHGRHFSTIKCVCES